MTYPPAPWTLKGAALQTLRLVSIERARPMVPAPLKIVPVLPGKTLSIVYFGDYQPGSSLVYHELIIAPALVRLGRRVGFWISHIYVDSPDSVAGGRKIWGLPKELARFEWDLAAGRVAAWQDNQLLCAFNSRPPGWGVPVLAVLPVISLLVRQVLAFRGSMTSRMGLAKGKLEIPADSPLASLNLGGPTTVFHFQHMRFHAGVPRGIS